MVATLRWALKDIYQKLTKTGYEITIWTFQPCHLWLRWTAVKPQEHKISRTVRGLTLETDKYYCFVVYRDNEQEEGGDTYVHTFLKEPWEHCETRWFYFHGRISDERSPSTSAIFTKHRLAPEWWRVILEPWTVTTQPPDMTRLILEPWTADTSPPGFTRVILEQWTS